MTYLHHKTASVLDADYRRALQERLYAKTRRVGDCVVFTGSNYNGYGRIAVQGLAACSPIHAHVLAYLLCVGDVPKGMDVGHLCNNKACVNVKHLKLMSRSENHLQARHDGLQCGKLAKSDVEQIKHLLAKGQLTQRQIAQICGTYQQTVSRIKRGLSFHWL